MSTFPPCPQCQCAYTYDEGERLVCPECAHSWSLADASTPAEGGRVVRDSNGNVLQDGDSVIVIKELKFKGGAPIKAGTKVKKIRLVEGDHDIDCRIEGLGAMQLKSEFVRKA